MANNLNLSTKEDTPVLSKLVRTHSSPELSITNAEYFQKRLLFNDDSEINSKNEERSLNEDNRLFNDNTVYDITVSINK